MLETLLPVLGCVLALLLDRLFGEPRFHPLILFGNSADWLEQRLNNRHSRVRGGVAFLIVISVPTGLLWWLQSSVSNIWGEFMLNLVVLNFVIGWQSMKEHASAIEKPLLDTDIDAARSNLAMIVSRQTEVMDAEQITSSTIESVLENGHDSVFASLFWFALLGPAGALLHRLVNTLDAMWGYKNERYLKFGFVAARVDDFLGFVPARLTALSYALCGSFTQAMTAWRAQIGKHKSPNAGLVMASGAGALGIIIGGPAVYDGILHDKPFLGQGEPATVSDISRSISLIERSLILWLGVYAIILVTGAVLR